MYKSLLALCVIFSCSSTFAAVVVQNQTFSTSHNVSVGSGSFRIDDLGSTTAANFSLFNTALGTLDSINIVINFDVTSSASATFLDNFFPKNAGGSQSVNQASIKFSALNYSSTKSVSVRSDSCSDSASFGPAVCTTNILPGLHATSGGPTINQNLFSATSLSSFSGAGSFAFEIDLRGQLITDAISGATITGGNGLYSSSGDITLTYNYSPVPVPAGVWLFASAIAGLGWFRLKRQ